MIVPILLNHDHAARVGRLDIVDGQLQVSFADDVKITREMAFEIFGNAGLQGLEWTEENGAMIVRRGRILEWSLSPAADVGA